MFELVADESSQQLGIEVHKLRFYKFESGLLRGSATHDSTTKNFSVLVEANYDYMLGIVAGERKDLALRHEFNKSRTHSISMGTYPSLDVADMAVRNLHHWYTQVLKKNGASHRLLIEEGNEQHLVEDTKASDLRYGEAILRARNVQAFAMLRDGAPLDHATVVGKIMPIFLQALGLKEYHLTHDLSKEGSNEVRFIIDRVGMFSFKQPANPADPAHLERYSFSRGNYHLNFDGTVNGHIMKTKVFDWLIAAARDLQVLTCDEKEIDSHIDEMAQDVRRSFIKRTTVEQPSVATWQQDLPANVVHIGAFRHS